MTGNRNPDGMLDPHRFRSASAMQTNRSQCALNRSPYDISAILLTRLPGF